MGTLVIIPSITKDKVLKCSVASATIFTLTAAIANPKEELISSYGEVSGGYISSCQALKILKQTVCPSINLLKEPVACLQDATNMLPITLQKDFYSSASATMKKGNSGLAETVKVGVQKMTNSVGGDLDKGCHLYSTSIVGYMLSKSEELARIARQIARHNW
jgi:hypothetical protein